MRVLILIVMSQLLVWQRLLLGRNDGSVTCFQLGLLHQTVSGFVSELRDDSGVSLGRLWGFMSRYEDPHHGEGKSTNEAHRERYEQASYILKTTKWATKESF